MRLGMLTMLNATRRVASGIGLILVSGSLLANNEVMLEGTTSHARYENKSELRLTVIDWSSDEQNQTVIESIKQWNESRDNQQFLQTMKDTDTKGYLFTGEATGYSIKYAAKNADGTTSVLITPGLKTKNRYMWEPAVAEDAPPYTLLEFESDSEVVELRTSLDGGIFLSDDGPRLQEGYEYPVFGEMGDATPYYLKESS